MDDASRFITILFLLAVIIPPFILPTLTAILSTMVIMSVWFILISTGIMVNSSTIINLLKILIEKNND